MIFYKQDIGPELLGAPVKAGAPAYYATLRAECLPLDSDRFDLLIYKRSVHSVAFAHHDLIGNSHSLCDLSERSILAVKVR